MKIIPSILAVVCACSLTACGSSSSSSNTKEVATKENETNSSETTSNNSTPQKEKTLVVYFSCTGNAEKIARFVSESLNAEIYEITPKEPYTADDLDYNDDKSRSSTEMNDKSARPEIAGKIENWESYSKVFLAYPIWWGEAPRIMDTFVESYDFSNKTVVSFVTSGGSGIGSSADTLKSLAGKGTWLKGKRFAGSEDKSEIESWVKSLEL